MVSLDERMLKVVILTPHAAAGPVVEIVEMSNGRLSVAGESNLSAAELDPKTSD